MNTHRRIARRGPICGLHVNSRAGHGASRTMFRAAPATTTGPRWRMILAEGSLSPGIRGDLLAGNPFPVMGIDITSGCRAQRTGSRGRRRNFHSPSIHNQNMPRWPSPEEPASSLSPGRTQKPFGSRPPAQEEDGRLQSRSQPGRQGSRALPRMPREACSSLFPFQRKTACGFPDRMTEKIGAGLFRSLKNPVIS